MDALKPNFVEFCFAFSRFVCVCVCHFHDDNSSPYHQGKIWPWILWGPIFFILCVPTCDLKVLKKKKKKEAEEKIKILRYTTRFMRLQVC